MTPEYLWTIAPLLKTFLMLLEPDTSPNKLEPLPDQDTVTHLLALHLSGCSLSANLDGLVGRLPADRGRAREKLETVALLHYMPESAHPRPLMPFAL